MKTIWTVLAFTLASPALAQAPRDASPAQVAAAQEMMVAMRIEDTMQKTMDAVLGQSMSAATNQALAALPAEGGIKDDPEFKAILNRHLDRVNISMSRTFREVMPDLVRELTAVYARNFTAAELEDITRFYQSSTGRRFLEKTPDLSRQTIDATQAILLPKVMSAMPALTRQMTDEIGAWVRQRKPAPNS